MNQFRGWITLPGLHRACSRPSRKNTGTSRFTHIVLLTMAGLGLGACATTVDVENSHLYRPPGGTVIELRTELTVAADKNQAYVQGGKVVNSARALHRYSPWCEFRVARSPDAMDKPWVIGRERFVVTSSHRGIDYSALQRARESMLFAGRDRILWPSHAEVSMENMATVMKIQSTEQPAVRSVVCMVFSDALYFNHLSLSEIRETLGNVAVIQLPTQQ